MLGHHDVARLTVQLGHELEPIGSDRHWRARIVRCRPRKELAVLARVDMHEHHQRSTFPKCGSELGTPCDDVGRGTRYQRAGDDSALEIDEDERGGGRIE